jgi:phage terminase large subunit-like protein
VVKRALKKPDDWRSSRNIKWIEDHCRIPEGRSVGKPVILRDWQRRILRDIYDNEFGTRRAIITFGKKNGKSAMAACLLLLHLCGPEHVPNTQLPSTAQSKEQAAVLFSLAAKMVRLNPTLDAVITIRDTIKQLHCPQLGTLYRALSAEASTAHGQSPIFAIHDELGQVRGPVSELFTAIENAMGAHDQPMSVIISTQAPTDGDLLSILIDDAISSKDPTVVLSLHTADLSLDPFSEEAIKQANPAFGDFLNRNEVLKQAENARRMPSQESLYRNYTLNQRVAAFNHLFSASVWEENGGQPDFGVFDDAKVYAGLDLSAKQDLTTLVLVAKQGDDWHVWPHFWSPEGTLRERADRDRAPYHVWAAQGHLTPVPGVVVGYEWVARRLVEIADQCDLQAVYFDRWRIDDFVAALRLISPAAASLPLMPYGQGYKDMGPAIDVLEAAALGRHLRHGMQPVLTWNAANAIIVSDPAGNRKFEKAKATGRIDGMVGLAMAMRAATIVETAPKSDFQMFFLGGAKSDKRHGIGGV